LIFILKPVILDVDHLIYKPSYYSGVIDLRTNPPWHCHKCLVPTTR